MKTETSGPSAYDVDGIRLVVVSGDLPAQALTNSTGDSVFAVDIETSGLDFRKERIGSIQVFDGSAVVYVVRPPFGRSGVLSHLISDETRKKVFHHAMFDLRFLRYELGMRAKNVACTKVAAKIVHPEFEKHSLADLARIHLGIRLDKSQQVSDWMSSSLSIDQISYAVRDVLYLKRILNRLCQHAHERGVHHLIKESFDYLPARVELDVLGIKDVYVY